MTPIKESWRVTKGHKGMIFGRMAIVIVIVMVLAGGFGLAIAAAGLSQGTMNTLINVLGTVIFGLMSYVAVVDIIRELVERGAFETIDPIHEEIEDMEIQGEVL